MICVANNPIYDWSHIESEGVSIYLKGNFYFNDVYYEQLNAVSKVSDIIQNICSTDSSIKNIKTIFDKIKGHYSFIVETPEFVLSVVDRKIGRAHV